MLFDLVHVILAERFGVAIKLIINKFEESHMINGRFFCSESYVTFGNQLLRKDLQAGELDLGPSQLD